jgi:BirA family biotin operon repressor/biotin-[acetyl-CoA-carboxylase] ligase
MQTFTLWMGLNICELVSNFCPVSPGIKWPNDLVFGDRKAGGMLTEARVDADQMRDLVFGLGLNVNSDPTQWPDDLTRKAVSLSEVAQGPVDLNRLTAALIGRVQLAYEKFATGEHTDSFAELWHRFDTLRGRTITLIEGEQRHEGSVLGVDDEGALLLKDTEGRNRRFRAGEVTIAKEG